MSANSSALLQAALAISVTVVLVGCAQQPTPPPVPSRSVVRAQPPDWFHQQVAAARAAKRAYQPKTDAAGAQAAYDDVILTACTRAAIAGPGKYPARCDAVLHPATEVVIDPCDANSDDPAILTECND